MTVRLSKLFGMDIYSINGEHKGKVFDLVINLEKGKVETITTEALKAAKTKQEAKKIMSEKSIPYKSVIAAKDIIITDPTAGVQEEEEDQSRSIRSRYRR